MKNRMTAQIMYPTIPRNAVPISNTGNELSSFQRELRRRRRVELERTVGKAAELAMFAMPDRVDDSVGRGRVPEFITLEALRPPEFARTKFTTSAALPGRSFGFFWSKLTIS